MNEKTLRKLHTVILALFALAVLGVAVYAGMDRQKATGVGYWFFLHYGKPSREFWDGLINIGICIFIVVVSIPGLFLNFKSSRIMSFSRFILFVFAWTAFPNPTFILNLFYHTPGDALEDIFTTVVNESLILIVSLFMLTVIFYFILKSKDAASGLTKILIPSFAGWGLFTALSLINPAVFGLWFFLAAFIPVIAFHILLEKTWALADNSLYVDSINSENNSNNKKQTVFSNPSFKTELLFFTIEFLCFLRCINRLLAITAAYNFQ